MIAHLEPIFTKNIYFYVIDNLILVTLVINMIMRCKKIKMGECLRLICIIITFAFIARMCEKIV